MSASTPLMHEDPPQTPTQRSRAHRRTWSTSPPAVPAADVTDLGPLDVGASGAAGSVPKWAQRPAAQSGVRRLSGRNLALVVLVGVLLVVGFEGKRFGARTAEVVEHHNRHLNYEEHVHADVGSQTQARPPTRAKSKPKYKPKPKVNRPTSQAVAPTSAPSAPAGLELDRTKLAFMIEPRNEAIMVPVLLDFIRKVPAEWPHLLFTSQKTIRALNETPSLRAHLASGKLALRPIPGKWHVHDGKTLSDFMTDPWLWEKLAPAEYLLTYQTDSILCSNSEYDVNDFLGTNMTDTKLDGGYAYVGAVWSKFRYPSPPNGGNGGLSLRRRSVMLEMTQKEQRLDNHNEDVWFVEAIKRHYDSERAFPDQDVAMKFSFETLPLGAERMPWALRPLGVHIGSSCKARVNNPRQRRTMRRLLEYCPEARMVIHNSCMPRDEDDVVE